MPLSSIIFLKSDILPKIKTLIKKPFSRCSPAWHFPSPVCWLLCLAKQWLQLLYYDTTQLSWWGAEEKTQKRQWEEDKKRRRRLQATCARVCVQHGGVQVQLTMSLRGMWLPTSVGHGDVWSRRVQSPAASGTDSQDCNHITNTPWYISWTNKKLGEKKSTTCVYLCIVSM